MSETAAVTAEQDGAGSADLNAPAIPPGHQIQSDASAKAMSTFLERATSVTADLGNKIEALTAVQKTQQQTNRYMQPGEHFDDVRVRCARSISELYNTQNGGGQLYNDVLYVADKMYLEHVANTARAKLMHETPPTIQKERLWPVYESLLKRANIWSTGGTGAGAEWVPTGVSSQRVPLSRLSAQVAGLFPSIPVNKMKRLDIPTIISSGAVTVLAQATTGNIPIAGTPNLQGTGVLSIQPIKHATPVKAVNMEMLEDSPADILLAITEDDAMALSHAQESGIYNGQPTNSSDLDSTNQSTNTSVLTPANGYATSTTIGYGLRYYAIFAGPAAGAGAPQDCGGTALTLANWEAGWAKMGRFAFDPSNVFIGAPKVVIDLSSDSNVRSFLNYGPGNPLPSGAVGRLHGIPIVPSQNVPNCLATGKVGASANNFTTGMFCTTRRWRVGIARDIEVKTWDIPQDDLIGIRGFYRNGIGNAPPAGASGDTHTIALINIAA